MNSYTNYITLLLILLFAGAASADTIQVPENYASIQGAVDCAEAGDTIHVSKGTYREHVVIDKPVILLGDSATIDGGCKGDVVTVKADGVTVSGFTLLNGVAGVNVSASGSIIENNRINNNEYGIVLMGVSDGIIMDNVIRGNTRHGIFLQKARNNVIIENLVTRNRGSGIHLQNSTDNIITDTVFSHNRKPQSVTDKTKSTNRHDMYIMQSDGNCIKADAIGHVSVSRSPGTIINGDVVDDTRYDRDAIDAIVLMGANDGIIMDNMIRGNTRHGIPEPQSVTDKTKSTNRHDIHLVQSDGNCIKADAIGHVSVSRSPGTIIDGDVVDYTRYDRDAIGVIDRASITQSNCTVADAKGLRTAENRITVSPADNTTKYISSNSVVVVDTGKTLYVPTQYPTIQAAIDSAVHGDTVYVFNGTYVENIVVDKRITLQGEDRSNTVIDGNGGTVVNINSPHVNISGFTIRNGSYGIYMVGVFMVGRDCRITDCNIHSNRHGIFFWRSCRDNMIRDCILHSNTDHGILLFMADSNNRIIDCTAYSNGKTGITLQKSCNNNTITNCSTTSNQQTGICLFQACSNNTITSCSAISNPQNGICAFMASSDNQITNCVVQDSFTGILLSHASAGNMVAGCDLSESTNGIHISHASAANMVTGCNTPENTNGISISHASTENTIQDCDIGSNVQRGILIAMASKENKMLNCLVGSAQHGVLLSRSSTGNTISGSTVGTTSLCDFMVEYASSGTLIETTFDTAGVRLASTLTVKNYLDVQAVLDGTDVTPIPGADVSVTDDGQAVYASAGYGGTDPATDPAGLCSGILVTDRIYRSNVATENTTLVSVKRGAWEEAERDVNMSESHTEVFTKPAT